MDRVTPAPIAPVPAVEPARGRREVWFGAALLAVGLLIGVASGPAATALGDISGDKMFWTASRLTAFLAYLAFAGSVCYGLGMASGLVDTLAGRVVSVTLHRDLALAGLALAAAHVFLLLGDTYIGFSVTELLVPGLSPYRTLPVAVGQICAWVAVATVISFYARGLMRPRLWRGLHTLSIVVFVLATIHGLFSGTDSRLDVIWWVYLGVALLVLFLATYRLANRKQRRLRAARPGG
jgi:sulfoxide reductase heme-binding subunit YedZ